MIETPQIAPNSHDDLQILVDRQVRLGALEDLSEALRNIENLEELPYRAAEILGQRLLASRVGYGTIDDVAETLHVDRDWTADGIPSLAGVTHLREYGSFIDSLRANQFIAIDDVRKDPRTETAAVALEARNARAFVNVPVVEKGRLVAVLYVNNEAQRAWREDELGLIRDVAERTRAVLQRHRSEVALKQSEARYRDLVATLEARVAQRVAERDQLWSLSQDMLARADYSGMMSAVSPAWTRVLGWSETELLSRGYATFMHPDDMGPTLELLKRMGETGLPARFENRISIRDGGWKPIEWTVTPEGDGANFIAVGRDLSATKAREAELAAAQAALRQSQKMEAMGQLTGGVAHDFNNLLTPIIGSLDMLHRRQVGGPREQRLIDGALQSAERAKTLVQRLLAFARRQPLQPTAVDVATLVRDMASLIASTSGPQVQLQTDIAPGLPAAKADLHQLEMAILNLAVNARDAMPEGGCLSFLVQESVLDDDLPSGLPHGHYVRLAVADTGVGMDDATARRATEPFFSTKGIGKGTGLGLSMVHGLVSQLGGSMTIVSRPGQGTTVELWLPVSADSAEPIERLANDMHQALRAGVALLVDDEEIVRNSTADMLVELGYQVIEAASATEALALIENGLQFDLLLTDHLMPGMTGTDLARRVRRRWPRHPVLVVSGFAEADGVASDIPRLTKPFRQADLARSLAAFSTD